MGFLEPPPNFAMVAPGVYRSAFPTPEAFGHMRLLALRTVINLSQEALTRAATTFVAENGVCANCSHLSSPVL